MNKKVLLLLIIALPLLAVAQQKRNNYGHGGPRGGYYEMQGQPGSALTIFSENGERFFLILNGIKQNAFPQSKIRIEDLPNVVNDIQIIFDDNQTPAINKTITFMDPVEGKPVNLGMKLVRDRSGYAYLVFNRMNSLEHDYRGEQGEYIMHYGRDSRDPRYDHGAHQVNIPPPPPPAPMSMDNQSFADAKKAIAGSSWDETRLSTAKTIFATNYLTTDQVMQICKIFSWEDSKLDFAKFAYKKTVDNNNYFKIGSIFSWDSNKTALNDFINANR